MAVTQYFEIAVPRDLKEGLLVLSRAEAEEMYRDLHGALYPGGVFRGNHAPVDEDELFDDTSPVGTQMSPEQALAAIQAMEKVEPSYQRNPGSGIGNG